MTGRPWPEKKKDDRARRRYFDEHPICQYCKCLNGIEHPAVTTHEIIFGSMSFDHEWNMITVCQEVHDIAHGKHRLFAHPKAAMGEIRRRMFGLKVLTYSVPDDIVEDFLRWAWYGKG